MDQHYLTNRYCGCTFTLLCFSLYCPHFSWEESAGKGGGSSQDYFTQYPPYNQPYTLHQLPDGQVGRLAVRIQ